jgi:resolvase-like protein
MGSELVKPHHLGRRAVVYVRQSSPHQVLTNQESLRLQYALRQRARELGWREADIDVIDADLGLSGAAAAHRQGFKDLVARVTLGEVGLILSTEVTRLARNCSDWYPLLDVCGHRQCLIADRDGVYDPTSRYPYPAEECSARAGNGHRSGASALWADVRARLADKGTRPGQLRPGCLPRRHHAEDPDRGDEPAAGRTEHACEQAHAPRHPGAGTPRHPGRTA